MRRDEVDGVNGMDDDGNDDIYDNYHNVSNNNNNILTAPYRYDRGLHRILHRLQMFNESTV